MKAAIIIVITISILATGLAFADQVSLPGLIGEHSYALGNRTVAFDFGGNLGEISSASLDLYGTINTSWARAGADTSIWSGQFSASISDPDGGFWLAYTSIDLNGEFHSIVVFHSLMGATWDCLSDGQGEMSFGFMPAGTTFGFEEFGPDPTGTISSATLIVEGTVATESQNWGHIKALYR